MPRFINFPLFGMHIACLTFVICFKSWAGDIRFKRLTSAHGLSQDSVYAICQDHQGFLWVGTERGMNRYDGFRFKTFIHDAQDTHSISNNIINTILEDTSNNLWIGTMNGLNRFDRRTELFYRFLHDPKKPQSLSNNAIRSLFQSSSGTLWAGSQKGLNRYDPNTDTFLPVVIITPAGESLAQDNIRGMIELPDQTLWLATFNGLVRFHPSQNQIFRYLSPLADNTRNINAIEADQRGNLWLATRGGLQRFDLDTQSFQGFPFPDKVNGQPNVKDIMIGEDEQIWAATIGQGIYIKKSGAPEFDVLKYNPANPNSLSGNTIYSLYQDHHDVLWIGSKGGLNQSNPNSWPFQYRSANTKLKEKTPVVSISQNPQYTWLGTRDGLRRIERATQNLSSFRPNAKDPTSIRSDKVWDILPLENGSVLIASSGGLNLYHPESDDFSNLSPYEGSAGSSVYKLHPDSSEKLIWLGTEKGLGRYELESEISSFYTPFPETPSGSFPNRIWAIAESPPGTLWLGAFGGGLIRMDTRFPGQFVVYKNKPGDPKSISNNVIWDIHPGKDGMLWIGTSGGLNRFNPQTDEFSSWMKDTRFIEDIYSILPGEPGSLWMGTNKGLLHFQISLNTATIYDVHDGLPFNEFSAHSRFKNQDGRLFFGGLGGMITFLPQKIRNDKIPPPVAITDLQVLGESQFVSHQSGAVLSSPISQTDSITLPYAKNMVSLEFAALHFAAPQNNQYAYKLENADRDWIYTGADRRFATYAYLKPGQYIFRVKAANRDGVWNEEGKTLHINILPPVWLTWWAKALYGIATLALLFGLFAYFSKSKKLQYQQALNARLQQLDRLKDDFLAKISHELRTPLNGIVGLTESAAQQTTQSFDDKVRADLVIAANCGRRLSALVDNLLDHALLQNDSMNLRLRSVDLHSVVVVVLSLLKPSAQSKNLRLKNVVSKKIPPVHADEDRLRQILYNLIDNGIKYTSSGFVRVDAEQIGEQVNIRVTDSGCGMGAEELEHIFMPYHRGDEALTHQDGVGLGLSITRELVNLHGGDLEIRSQPGEGSTFLFSLPVSYEQPTPSVEAIINPEITPFQTREQSPGRRILTVDDEPVNQRVIAAFLKPAGYQIISASNGDQALTILNDKSQPIDLILLDIMMPGLSGYEVCRLIRNEYSSHQLPIIFLSAKSQQQDLIAGFEAGGNDFLGKPVDSGELLVRINLHLDLLDSYRDLEARVSARTRQVRELHQEKDRFFTNISHEIRTPLTLITSPLNQLLNDISPHDPPQRRLQLERAVRHCDHLTRLVNELLDIAKLDAGHMTLNNQTIELSDFIRRIIPAFDSWAERRKISLSTHSDFAQIHLTADAGKLEKILYNLIANAFKYTQSHGKIFILLDKDADHVIISVKDTGRGIPKDQLPHIFDRFHQTNPGQGEGSGLGLALSQQLARLHGGEIRVSSQEGFGSEFTLQLPVNDMQDNRTESPPISQNITLPPMVDLTPACQFDLPEHAHTVLVVDDHPDMRHYLKELLASKYHVFEAENGLEALTIVKKSKIDLVITDVLMPQMDGYQLSNYIKNDPKTNHTPILLLTAEGSPGKIAGLDADADAWLAKPFNVGELVAQVENLIRTRNRVRDHYGQTLVLTSNHHEVDSEEAVFLQNAARIIEARVEDELFGVTELAYEMAVSERQLRRRINNLTGKNPAHFIREIRLDVAARLLASQVGSVAEIAHRVGFKKTRYFSNIFQKRFGVLPSAYAKHLEQKSMQSKS